MQSSDVVVACVAEDRPEWYRMVENLAVSVRTFGGRLATARIVAHFVDSYDEASVGVLRELDVQLRVVARYDLAYPTTNKLRMFQEFAERADARYLVALDCDTVVVGDLTAAVLPGVVRGMPAMRSHLAAEQWAALLSSLDLQPEVPPTVTTKTREPVPAPYLNSGVLFVPVEHATPLANAWTRYVEDFVAQAGAGVDEPWTGRFLDQVALACALLATQTPVRTFGPELNLPTAARLTGRVPANAHSRIKLIHYHKHVTPTGYLRGTDSPAVNAIVDRVNTVLAARTPRPPPPPRLVTASERLWRRLSSSFRS